MLGIIGGMGPHAGKNLFKCVLDQSKAAKDQDHLPLILWSTPNRIVDRTEFLKGEININPAYEVATIVKQICKLGVQIIGIPCNTFHAQPIWLAMQQCLIGLDEKVQIINMVDCTASIIKATYPKAIVGILGTLGTYQYNVFGAALADLNIVSIVPKEADKRKVHEAVYHPTFGIKAAGHVTAESLQIVHSSIEQLNSEGATIILLGCTEFSLIAAKFLPEGVLFIDPVIELAKAMIAAYRDLSDY